MSEMDVKSRYKEDQILSAAEINELISQYKQANENGDMELRDCLFEIIYASNCKLIYKIMLSRYPSYVGAYREDMLQYCAMELFSILPNYDPGKGAFTTYLTPSILHACQKFVDNLNGYTSHYSTHIKKIKKYLNEAEAYNLPTTAFDIAIATEIPIHTVERCLEKINSKEMLVYNPSNDIIERARGYERSPEEAAIEQEEKDALMRSINTLDAESRKILKLKYGFGRGGQMMTETDIAKTMNVSKQVIHRTIVKAQNRLRTILQKSTLFTNRVISDEIDELSKKVVFVPGVSKEDLTEAVMFMQINDDIFQEDFQEE